MRCSRCFELLDMDGPCPAWDHFSGGLVCDACHEGEWQRLSFPEDVREEAFDA